MPANGIGLIVEGIEISDFGKSRKTSDYQRSRDALGLICGEFFLNFYGNLQASKNVTKMRRMVKKDRNLTIITNCPC